jgi:hypothetical protein
MARRHNGGRRGDGAFGKAGAITTEGAREKAEKRGEDEEDVDLSEFSDEIEDWVLDEFRKIGLDTAKSVLAISKEDIARRTELEEETIDEILGILSREFE